MQKKGGGRQGGRREGEGRREGLRSSLTWQQVSQPTWRHRYQMQTALNNRKTAKCEKGCQGKAVVD